MTKRLAPSPIASSLLLLATLVFGCSGGGGGGNGGEAGTGAGGSSGSTATCDAASLEGCDYPSRGLSITVRDQVAITDSVTGRTLPLLVRIPDVPGPLPLVIWSHGGGFNDAGHRLSVEWGETLAAHGYVVVHIAHVTPDATALAALCTLAAIPTAECLPPAGDADSTGLFALVKTRDVIAVLDQLPMLSQASEAQGGPAIDLSRVAVAGWSAGSRAPLITHGAVFYPSPSAPKLSLEHSLPAAAIVVSPVAPGYAGFFEEADDDTWVHTRGPILTLTGHNDLQAAKPDLTGEGRRIAYERQPADGTRWLLFSNLDGVGSHTTFSLDDLGSSDERLLRLSHALQASARAFLDATLDGDAEARAYLSSGNAAVLAGDASWDHH
ncbi:MAG: hypothetical protein R3B72_26190 [Polyangiaceae bacterium]